MNRRTLLAGLFLLGAAGLGTAAMASDRTDVADARDRDRERRRERRHRDDDDRHGDRDRRHDRRRDRDGGCVRTPNGPGSAGSNDPTRPVPDNGLFGGKGRPKVEVN